MIPSDHEASGGTSGGHPEHAEGITIGRVSIETARRIVLETLEADHRDLEVEARSVFRVTSFW
ncbi:hypothetical protein KCV87_07415 [Actinosynnema pretiosum subsp. pretiosum]|uniref:Uncharacterized protein n=2 Tax=Actinosynnema TaxID=40566 RepID=C6WLA6_ACTMD|nr:hypothetical protein [Actinosynnema mirum]ACU36459.1 hypothetical protein Amir_2521 [Actinosynnema mirum DSM 43827]AXX29909.1 hypothetical protein APASM_2544 [Actinosynnema pretiosum subsp. pretiosum]QUF05893.1 hypothetical protein KCV87_07415 [Actinosynnema pretiosum subsp. pretiosum]